jgi:hypothetical protein
MNWLAATQFPTREGFLEKTSKVTYFSHIKNVWKKRFPKRDDVWNNEPYWSELMSDFKKKVDNSRMADPNVEEIRKSAPLFRDLSGTRCTAVRAKYLNDKVDARSIAMAMIEEGSVFSVQKLAEFVLCRVAIGRGGEHVFLRWTEAFWDEFFHAPDFDWSVIKTNNVKCTLLFGDRHLYCLCPLFAIGVFMLFGGLRRDKDNHKGTIINYVFPTLHNKKKESVADDGLSRQIKKIVKAQVGGERAKLYSSRSLRKGAMTENRVNRSLSTQEEYARSGHSSAPDQNPNAEGYIETTAAMSAPAGKALAGYPDPHAPAFPMSFECLNGSVNQSVIDGFLSNLIINDVECLREDGAFREMLVTCAATMIGWYNDLYRDVGEKNPIVNKIRSAAQKSQLTDSSLTPTLGAPMWNLTLKSWSQRIKDDFQLKNPESFGENATLVQQYMGLNQQIGSVHSRLGKVESCVTQLSKSNR